MEENEVQSESLDDVAKNGCGKDDAGSRWAVDVWRGWGNDADCH